MGFAGSLGGRLILTALFFSLGLPESLSSSGPSPAAVRRGGRGGGVEAGAATLPGDPIGYKIAAAFRRSGWPEYGLPWMIFKSVSHIRIPHASTGRTACLAFFVTSCGSASPRNASDRGGDCRRALGFGRSLLCRNRAPWDR